MLWYWGLSPSPLHLKELPSISPPQHLPLSHLPAFIRPCPAGQSIKLYLSCLSSPPAVHVIIYKRTSLSTLLNDFLSLGCQVEVSWMKLVLHSLFDTLYCYLLFLHSLMQSWIHPFCVMNHFIHNPVAVSNPVFVVVLLLHQRAVVLSLQSS